MKDVMQLLKEATRELKEATRELKDVLMDSTQMKNPKMK
jgi:hypothetical protein